MSKSMLHVVLSDRLFCVTSSIVYNKGTLFSDMRLFGQHRLQRSLAMLWDVYNVLPLMIYSIEFLNIRSRCFSVCTSVLQPWNCRFSPSELHSNPAWLTRRNYTQDLSRLSQKIRRIFLDGNSVGEFDLLSVLTTLSISGCLALLA